MTVDTQISASQRSLAEATAFKMQRRHARRLSIFDPEMVRQAAVRSFAMLDPRSMMRNPVMFLVELGTVLTAIVTVQSIVGGAAIGLIVYQTALTLLLLLTVLFANFAEALAEARGKAQADSLRATRQDTPAYRLDSLESQNGQFVPSTQLRTGDLVLVETGQVIPSDGEVVVGVASVDESAITGESAPVIREAGGDRSGVTGGTRVLSDRIIVQVTSEAGESFLDRMIALVEGAIRQKTPNEIALDDRAGGVLAHLPHRDGRALPDGPVLRPDPRHPDVDRALGLLDPDDHRRLAGSHRHCWDGPRAHGQHHRQERQGRRACRRH